jgi:hypothetical protein
MVQYYLLVILVFNHHNLLQDVVALLEDILVYPGELAELGLMNLVDKLPVPYLCFICILNT